MIPLYITHMKEMVNCLPIRDECTKGRKEGRRKGKDGAGKGRQFVPSKKVEVQISACEYISPGGVSSILSSSRYRCPILKYFYKGICQMSLSSTETSFEATHRLICIQPPCWEAKAGPENKETPKEESYRTVITSNPEKAQVGQTG